MAIYAEVVALGEREVELRPLSRVAGALLSSRLPVVEPFDIRRSWKTAFSV
jgi:hypothetical protein